MSEKTLYYCRFCGVKTYSKHWDSALGYRCPRCGSSVPPKKW